MAPSSPPSSPLYGYDTAGEEPDSSSSEDIGPPARSEKGTKPPRASGRPTPRRSLQRDSKGRFLPKRPPVLSSGDGDDSEIGSAADLLSVDSLTWENFAQPQDTTAGTRHWSSSTQYGVSVANSDVEDRLPALLEGRESAAGGRVTDQSFDTVVQAPDVPEAPAMTALEHYQRIERALLEIEDDCPAFSRPPGDGGSGSRPGRPSDHPEEDSTGRPPVFGRQRRGSVPRAT